MIKSVLAKAHRGDKKARVTILNEYRFSDKKRSRSTKRFV